MTFRKTLVPIFNDKHSKKCLNSLRFKHSALFRNKFSKVEDNEGNVEHKYLVESSETLQYSSEPSHAEQGYFYLLYFLCVYVVPYVYLLYYVCIAVLTLDAGLLTRSQYQEGPATGHLDTGFSRFPSVYKRILRRFPSFQVATTCLSCSPPDLNSLVTFFFLSVFVYM